MGASDTSTFFGPALSLGGFQDTSDFVCFLVGIPTRNPDLATYRSV